LVQELPTAIIGGVTYNNPVASDQYFDDFIVGIPRWVEDATHVDGGEWLFDVRVYPKSEIEDYPGTYKEEVEVIGNVITWEIGHAIPNAVASLPYFGATDILSQGLRFVEGSVVGRFTRRADEGAGRLVDASASWNDATGVLTNPTHFTVANVGQRIDITITPAGRALLAAEGLLGEDGFVMFRLGSEIMTVGNHSNVVQWNVGEEPYCPITDPTCDPGICPPTDPDCDDYCPVGDPTCDNARARAFNL